MTDGDSYRGAQQGRGDQGADDPEPGRCVDLDTLVRRLLALADVQRDIVGEALTSLQKALPKLICKEMFSLVVAVALA